MLGRPAIDALNLVQKVDTIQSDESSVDEDEVKSAHPNLFKGLGELDGDLHLLFHFKISKFYVRANLISSNI